MGRRAAGWPGCRADAGPAEPASQASAPAPTFTLQQTLSDEAQRNTIAFDGNSPS